MRVYLDHNAGSQMRDAVRNALVDALGWSANASSVYQEGRKAKGTIERARDRVAALVGADPKAVTFTSGGSEGAATVLQTEMSVGGKPRKLDRLLISATEHDCVLKGGFFAPEQITKLPVDAAGLVDLEALRSALHASEEAGETVLVAIMFANNETGVLQPVEAIGALAAEHNALFFCDAVQAPGRVAIDINNIGAHFLTLSAHKLGGPQGVGAIVRRSDAYAFKPLIRGGGQEAFGRAGTENMAAIHGFGVAADEALSELQSMPAMAAMRDAMEAELQGVTIMGADAPRLANTSCILVPGLSAETLLIALDLKGFALSSGSACSSGKVSASHVLQAMGQSEEAARSALRISFGWNTKKEDVNRFVSAFNETVCALSRNSDTSSASAA